MEATNEKTDFAENYSLNGTIQEIGRKSQLEDGWQAITISGVAGILMGAGAMYALDAFADVGEKPEPTPPTPPTPTPPTPPVPVINNEINGLRVSSVDQNLPFGQAFAAARAEVGPGGVFHWHGGVFNTYYLNEWNQMSSADRAAFARQVQPEIQAKPENISLQGDGSNLHIHIHVHSHENEVVFKPDDPKPEQDSEVHFLGFDDIEIDGQEYEAGHMTAEGRHVYLLDLDADPEHVLERAITDIDQDDRLTMGESVDISDRHITIEEFALMSVLDDQIGDNSNTNTGPSQIALNTQDDIAPGMPDYVNDANPMM